MRCLISRPAFRRRLAAVAAVVPRSPPEPILGTIRLEVDGHGRGSLAATDRETWVRIQAPILRAPRAGSAQLPGRALLAALGDARDRDIQLDYDPEAFSLARGPDDPPFSLAVAGSRTRTTLRTHRPEDFPVREEGVLPGHHEIEIRHLQRLIRTTAFATDPGSERYTLGGCWFGFGAGSIEAVATDGHRLAHAWRADVRVIGTPGPPAESAPGDRSRALAPIVGERALRVLDGLLKELKGPSQEARLAWTADGFLRVEAPGLSFATRQLAGRFPAWREVFPPPSPHRGHWGRSDRLLALLKRAKALTGRDHPAVHLGLRPGVLTLAVRTADGGTCAFEMSCDYRSGPTSADFDPARLIDVLAVVKDEAIDLELNGPATPAVLHAAGLRYCVMPLPMKEEAGKPAHGEGLSDDEAADDRQIGSVAC